MDDECKVVYLLAEVRKLLDPVPPAQRPPALNLYCHWALHLDLHGKDTLTPFLQEVDAYAGRVLTAGGRHAGCTTPVLRPDVPSMGSHRVRGLGDRGAREPACETHASLHSVYTEYVFEWDPRKAEANAAKHSVTLTSSWIRRTRRPRPAALVDGVAIPSAWTVRRRAGAHRGLYAEEKWRCRNDPDHQRAAREPPRTCGVRVEGLTIQTFASRRPNS